MTGKDSVVTGEFHNTPVMMTGICLPGAGCIKKVIKMRP
jgi:hypothetical protein